MAEGLRRVEESLRAAAEGGDIEGLYASIKEDPIILDRIDAIPFVETPLHVAASAGQELFTKEILRLKPSFGPKLNPDGLSSLHLALIKRKFDMAKVLINLDKQLIRVKGKEGETPLHFIVKNEDIDHVAADQQQRVGGNVNGGQQEGEDPRILILAELLFACPNSIEDRTIRDETALHIAVKNNNKHAVEVILGVIHRTSATWVRAARDFEGNTILHMAVSNSQSEMVELIVKEFTADEINIRNYVAKKTALELLPRTDEAIEQSLRAAGADQTSSPSVNVSLPKFLSSPEKHDEVLYKNWFAKTRRYKSMENRSLGLVVAVLIATTTFEAVLSPPGGGGGGGGGGNYDQLLRNGSYLSAIVPSSNHPFATANTSFINATLLITPTHIEEEGESMALPRFYFLNTAAFSFSVVMIMFLLPETQFLPLHCALVFLTFGYLTSFLLVTSSSNLPVVYYGLNIVLLLSVVLVYFYMLFWQTRNGFPRDDERFRMLGILLRNYGRQCSHGQLCNGINTPDNPLRYIIEEARRLISCTQSSLDHVPRQANQTTDRLARMGSQQEVVIPTAAQEGARLDVEGSGHSMT